MKTLRLSMVAFAFLLACAPAIQWVNPNETALKLVEIPNKVDRGDRFGDPNAEELDRPQNELSKPELDESFPEQSGVSVDSEKEKTLESLNQKIISNAEYVVAKERTKRGIGEACNYFLQRVLMLSGFANEGYVANDFHVYAKSAFANQKTAQFNVEPLRKDTKALHQFLFTHPEGTPFILQWRRAEGRGHLAIVVRKGEQLIIYEASLGRFKAEKKLTNARTILSASERYKLTVFANFMPSGK